MRVSAAIVAGGRATRMGGVHKGLVTVGGEPIVARQLRALAPLVDACAVVAGDSAPYAPVAGNAVLLRDRQADRGPLAGLDAALHALDCDALLVFACDLPFIDRELILTLRDRSPDAPALVPRVDGRPQPLAARYAKSIAPTVRAQLERGQLAMMALLDAIAPAFVDLPPTRALFNVNTPADLARAEELARSG